MRHQCQLKLHLKIHRKELGIISLLISTHSVIISFDFDQFLPPLLPNKNNRLFMFPYGNVENIYAG